MKIDKYLKINLLQLISLVLMAAPLLINLILIVCGAQILDSDANTYHLFNARLIADNNLSYFSSRPVTLANELGIGVSSHFPWLYSYLVAKISVHCFISLDNSAYLVNCLVYLGFLAIMPWQARPLFAILMLMPSVFYFAFNSGANYYLTSFFGFLLYKIIAEGHNRWMVLCVSLLLSQAHVLGFYLSIIIIGLSGANNFKNCLAEKILQIVVLSGLHFYWNFTLTGSPTFPFLQNFFPHKYYNQYEWMLVQKQITNGIYVAFKSMGILALILYLFKTLLFVGAVYFSRVANRVKFLVGILIVPVFLIPYFGMRHRIIFALISISIFLYEIFRNDPGFISKLKFLYVRISIWLVPLIGIVFFISTIIKNSGLEIKEANFQDVKQCYYKTVDDLSKDYLVMMSETELLRIENYSNVIPIDGKNMELYFGSSNEENATELLKSNVKYIATSPLSEANSVYVEHAKLYDAINVLRNRGRIKLVKDCISDAGFSEKYVEKLILKDGWYGWRIYEIIK